MRRPGIAERSNTRELETAYDKDILTAQRWFAEHVKLFGQPYALDTDQVRAAIDTHHNTLVTARAGSGKTRVIVAKVAYLVAHQLAKLDEILIFMFNRTAAAEVNERLAAVEIDGQKLPGGQKIAVASTFHKFALDTVKATGSRPQIVVEDERAGLIQELLFKTLSDHHLRLSHIERQEMLSIVNNFVTRAGQKFPGLAGLADLEQAVSDYCHRHQNDVSYARKIRFHQVSRAVYREYLAALKPPKTDFNLLVSQAIDILHSPSCPTSVVARVQPLKYLLIDEYQDFSYLFFAIVQAIRSHANSSHLFAVGDDWQAINRFAGSDVDYFIEFAKYFPGDTVNIPLATNYRSHRSIVETANRYMLTNYDPGATPAIAKEHRKGKISITNPSKIKVDLKDITEDGMGDGRFIRALEKYRLSRLRPLPTGAIQLLKAAVKIIAKHPYDEFMLLHRHNFTSFDGVTLSVFAQALAEILVELKIMTANDFAKPKQIRFLTMHRSKGLEATNVILLELDREIVQGEHPHATIFELFGDTRAAEIADQQRLIYVAITRAKKRLYVISKDEPTII